VTEVTRCLSKTGFTFKFPAVGKMSVTPMFHQPGDTMFSVSHRADRTLKAEGTYFRSSFLALRSMRALARVME